MRRCAFTATRMSSRLTYPRVNLYAAVRTVETLARLDPLAILPTRLVSGHVI
jgi:hypothetical protein